MTALEACDKIQEAIDGLHEETRNSGWDWSFTEKQSDEDHLSDYKETLDKTRAHFSIEGDTSSWFVSTNGTNAVLAKCGNSPTSEGEGQLAVIEAAANAEGRILVGVAEGGGAAVDGRNDVRILRDRQTIQRDGPDHDP